MNKIPEFYLNKVSFDDILNAKKDVLKRLKVKGD